MLSAIILLLSIDNYSCMLECGGHIVLGCTGAAGNHNAGASCLEDRTEYRRLGFDVQTHTDSQSGEGLRPAKLFSQSLQEPLVEFCPANLRAALLHELIVECARFLFIAHRSSLPLSVVVGNSCR